MNEEMRLILEADCNSLNAIATSLRHDGKNREADCLLSIESRIFKLIDILKFIDDIFADIYNG